jgi:hypothetical protein
MGEEALVSASGCVGGGGVRGVGEAPGEEVLGTSRTWWWSSSWGVPGPRGHGGGVTGGRGQVLYRSE